MELATAERRGGSPDYNLLETTAQSYAQTSIIQFECGPYAPPKPPGVAVALTDYTDASRAHYKPDAGYAVMVRMKGMFAESIAPRPLTVLPGYGRPERALQQTGTKALRRIWRKTSEDSSKPALMDAASTVNLQALQACPGGDAAGFGKEWSTDEAADAAEHGEHDSGATATGHHGFGSEF